MIRRCLSANSARADRGDLIKCRFFLGGEGRVLGVLARTAAFLIQYASICDCLRRLSLSWGLSNESVMPLVWALTSQLAVSKRKNR